MGKQALRLLTVLVAGATLAGWAATSSAKVPKVGFDLRAKGEETRGKARAVGKIQLQSNKKGLRRAVVKGRLNDVCPKDGFRAYLQVRAYYPTDASVAYSSDFAEDPRGCKAPAKDVVLKTGWVDSPYKITIQLYEFDAEAGNIAFRDEARVEYTPDDLGS
jgi:hypothetical protein